jgi:hypothetical protein
VSLAAQARSGRTRVHEFIGPGVLNLKGLLVLERYWSDDSDGKLRTRETGWDAVRLCARLGRTAVA